MRAGFSSWLRRTALVLAGLLAFTVMASGPAAAAPYKSKLCWPVWSNGQLKIYCVDIQVELPWDKFLECWMCGISKQYTHDPVIREDIEGVIGEEIVNGLGKLGQAEFTRDPAQRAKLQDEAMGAFTSAARLSDKSTMKLKSTGIADPEKNTFSPAEFDWLTASGNDVADGVSLLQRSFADPANAGRLRSQAAAQFDEAYHELSEQQAIGG